MQLLNGKRLLIQGGMALKSSMGLSGAVAAQSTKDSDVVTVGVVAITGQGSNQIAKSIIDSRTVAGARALIGVNVMAADSRMSVHLESALKTGEVDLAIQGAGVSKDAPALCKKYGVPFVPIISRPEQVVKYNRMFDVAAFIFEGLEAGGHIGSLEHGLFRPGDCTLEEIVAAADGTPVIAAGAISPDRVQSIIARGASGIQIATPYLLTEECELTLEVKKFYASANHEDVVLVDSPAGMPGRSLANHLTRSLEEGESFPPERYGMKCVNCIKRCKCRDAMFRENFCIRAALLAAKNGDLDLGLYFVGDGIGDWNELTDVKTVTDLYMTELNR